MRKWLLLVSAILLEVTATLSMRAAPDHPAWYALMVSP
jgi:small multidrug resistance pump